MGAIDFEDAGSSKQPEARLQKGNAAQMRLSLKLFRLLVRTVFQLVFRVRVLGLENVPRQNAVVAMNHLGWAEGFMVLLFLPSEPRIYGLGVRQVLYVASWRTRMINWMEIFIPLDRDKPRQALRAMEDVLKRGGSLVLAAEGKLGEEEGKLAPLQHGAAGLSQAAGVPLLPVGATGTKELWLGKRLTLRVGKPIFPNEFEGHPRTRTRDMTARLEKDMLALLPGDDQHPRFRPLGNWLTKLF
jgi:1-acyl-sn-glycerol-3-phosphate acyltransferase